MSGSTRASNTKEVSQRQIETGRMTLFRAQRPWQAVLRFVQRRPLGAVGAAIVILMALAALLAEIIAPFDPLQNDYGAMFNAPGATHWLGTDSFGRDVLSRLLYGSRTALWVGFSSSLFASTVGAALGVTAAYFGGKVDLLLQRLLDILISFPLIVLALVVVALLGSGIWNVIVAIAIPMIPRAALVLRSSSLALRQMLFVEAALTLGAGHARVIFSHMLPNVVAPFLIILTAFLGQAILLEASLSFLGLGVAEPTAAWGLMLRGAAVDFAERAPWMALFPGLAISLAVFAFNVFGDSLRDALDPKLRVP
jgi:peptide/nickel transport system permease protein